MKPAAKIAQRLSPTQRDWVLDLARAPVSESRSGNRASAAALNPLLGPSSGEDGPDVVTVDYASPRSRTWDLTDFGREVARQLAIANLTCLQREGLYELATGQNVNSYNAAKAALCAHPGRLATHDYRGTRLTAFGREIADELGLTSERETA